MSEKQSKGRANTSTTKEPKQPAVAHRGSQARSPVQPVKKS